MKVLCGASVRRDPAVLKAHLKTLRWQKLPSGLQLDLVHVDDLLPEQRVEGMHTLSEAGSRIIAGVAQPDTMDFDDKHPQTHQWQLTAFERVAENKQRLLDLAVAEHYDYVWIVDTDLLLDPYTLWSLYACKKDITAAVYWTRWQAADPICHPQV